jgi:hypothetical protein
LPKLRLAGENDTAGAVVPVPLNDTVCGLPLALSVVEILPLRDPPAVGVKVTEIVHVPAATIEAPQVLVWLKSPLAAMLLMVSGADPVLVSVTVCATPLVFTNWLPKLRLVGAKDTAGAVVPVPLSVTVCGLPPALSVIVTLPLRVPPTVGVKVTEIVHVPAAAIEAPQVLLWLKSPLAAMLLIVSAADPVLVSVTVWAALLVFTNWLPKLRLVGEKDTAGAVVPVPLRATVCGLPLALSVTVTLPLRKPDAVGLKVTEIVHVPAAAIEAPQVLVWL